MVTAPHNERNDEVTPYGIGDGLTVELDGQTYPAIVATVTPDADGTIYGLAVFTPELVTIERYREPVPVAAPGDDVRAELAARNETPAPPAPVEPAPVEAAPVPTDATAATATAVAPSAPASAPATSPAATDAPAQPAQQLEPPAQPAPQPTEQEQPAPPQPAA